MALHWNVEDVKDEVVYTTSPWDKDKWHPITETIVWALLGVDIGTITKDNVDEIWWRHSLLNALHGNQPDLVSQTMKAFVVKQDFINHIGLSTNVSTVTSRKKWLSGLANRTMPSVSNPDDKSAHELCDEAAKEVEHE